MLAAGESLGIPGTEYVESVVGVPLAPVEIPADVLYVVHNTVTTGAAFAAFSTELGERWPGVRPVPLALVFSPKCET